MVENSDLIIVGAGIVGLSSAYYIKKNNPDITIKVIDRASTFAQGNTGKSAAGFRNLFTSDINFKLSDSTTKFYRHVQEEMGIDLGMKFVGYLFLFGKNMPFWVDVMLERKIAVLKNPDDVFEDGILSKMPQRESADLMSLQDVENTLYGPECGIIEPDLVSSFYYDECRKMGVEFQFSTEVKKVNMAPVQPLNFPGEPFIWQDKKIESLTTDRGDLTAERYIFATDVWTTGLLDPIGIDSHIRPKKRQVFQISGESIQRILFSCKLNDEHIIPFTILPKSGVYLRPAVKERSLWVGVADDLGRDFSFTEDPQAEEDFYNYNLRTIAESYFPGFKNSSMTAKWAGYYSYNTLDKTPWVFRFMNAVVATGTSGSGILKGDAIGRIVDAYFSGREKVQLYGGSEIPSSALDIKRERVEDEHVIL